MYRVFKNYFSHNNKVCLIAQDWSMQGSAKIGGYKDHAGGVNTAPA
jgi:hypothetical protein